MGLFQINGKDVSKGKFEKHMNKMFNLVDPDLQIKLKVVEEDEILLQSYDETIWRGSAGHLSRAFELARGDLWEFFSRLDEVHMNEPVDY